jgi:signal transduction histidine kinase
MQDPHSPGSTLHHGRGPSGDPPDPADAPFALERLTVLSHELNNLLDGSLRCLGLARRSIKALPTHAAEVEGARRQLDTVYGALERMADLVNAAMRGTSAVVGSPALSPKRAITLAEAVTHAADVIFPEAQELGVTVRVDLAAAVGPLPIGPLYSVLLNGLRNAMESIALVAHPAA